MAKGQMKSNKDIRKPKKDKAVKAAEPAGTSPFKAADAKKPKK
ncbi:MAG: hypothetical protein WAU86_22905 [Oricola sp.]